MLYSQQVRLILTLTPVVCVLSAIGFSRVFELYLKEDTDTRPKEKVEKKTDDDAAGQDGTEAAGNGKLDKDKDKTESTAG